MKARSRPAIALSPFDLGLRVLPWLACWLKTIADNIVWKSSKESVVELTSITSESSTSTCNLLEDLPNSDWETVFDAEIDELPYTTVNDDSLLFKTVNLHIRKSTVSLFM